MGIFDSALADDARFTFTDTDVFGESVTLIFSNGTADRTVKAQVARNGLLNRVEVEEGVTSVLLVSLQNSATLGLAQSEWDGNVKVRIATPSPGVPTFDFLLPPWDTADAGMLNFRIRT